MNLEDALAQVMEDLRAMDSETFMKRLEESKRSGLYEDLKALDEFERYLIETVTPKEHLKGMYDAS